MPSRQSAPMPIPLHLFVRSNGDEVRGQHVTVDSIEMLLRDPSTGKRLPSAWDTRSMGNLSVTTATDWLDFRRLVEQWKRETAYLSMVEDMILSESYQRIIGMGPKAIPMILSQIETEGANPDHWWWALRVLARHDPVPLRDRGNVAAMAKYWLEWGRVNQLAR